MEIHVISNGRLPLDHFAEMAGKIASYVDYFHLREKTRSARELFEGVQLLEHQGVPLSKVVVNDRADAALASGAGGVHLAYHSLPLRQVKQALPQLRVGLSVHSVEEAMIAAEAGADYVMFGHIFPTASKPDRPPKGLGALADVVRATATPVIAIGGIRPEHAAAIEATGARGMAIMSGIAEAQDPVQRIEAYLGREGGERQ